MELTQQQLAVLQQLARDGKPRSVPQLAAACAIDQSQIAAAGVALAEADLVTQVEATHTEYKLGPEGAKFAADPLPERVIIAALQKLGGNGAMPDVAKEAGINPGVVGQSLRWLNQRGWAKKDGGNLVLADNVDDALAQPQADEQMIKALADDRVATDSELAADGVDVAAAMKLLGQRKGFVVAKERTTRTLAITDKGTALVAGGATAKKRVTQLTPEMLTDGSWRNADLAPYDVTLKAKAVHPGKEHPFQRTLDRVRRVFLEMGFTEIVSPWVESSFWDFDALYQPQDHPARDMQDTFYVAKPAKSKLPDDDLVEQIKRTHEDGGDTGSTGWQYRWRKELAGKPVLRTHTTAATIRALHKHTQGEPGKYFVIGPVFRRETVDFKHLPIFHQVDGIIVDPKASLATLKGTLAAFYGKMGFPKVQFAPSFFPYTEPSAEVFAYLQSREQFVEMGGSGIFRPEVTRPLGISDRVLAWGLGLERLAMLIHGLDAIGDIYFPSMPWLREAPLSRS